VGIRRQKNVPGKVSAPASEVEPVAAVREDLIAVMDDLLDEIDEALEANAEEFVRNYVQKGGE